jgi:hypothetical protein
MRSMGEGHALAILTFWRGDTLNAPLQCLRRCRSPYWGGITPISSTGCDGPAVAPQRLRLPRNGEECIQAGAYDVCLGWTTGAIGPSLRWGDGNFGDGCVISKIDIY